MLGDANGTVMTKLFSAAVVLGALAGTAIVAGAGCASSQSDEDVGTALGAAGGQDAGDAGPAPLANGTLLITQVYSYGGHSGAKFKYDFVEILNKTTKDIDLEASNVSLQLSSSATGPFDTAIPLKGTIGGSKYRLIQLGTRNSGIDVQDLPAADQTGTADQTIGESGDKAANGKVALANITNALGCGGTGSSCGTSKVIDVLGFGQASFFEGSSTAKPLDATHTLLRAGNDGCTDSGDNSKDFALTEITDTTKPRNASSDAKDCTPPPKPDAGKDSGPPPPPVDEPDPGKEIPFDAGTRREAGAGSQAAGDDDDGCSVGPIGLGEGFGSFAPLAALALAVTLVSRRRRGRA